MAHTYRISEFGLKLIKAYEGFRPVETKLVSGQRVIGYGHVYEPGEIVMLTKNRAGALLLTDLAPYEALINNNVYAPLSQSQFDALVALSFNIGEDAFLKSNVLYRLNTGQPLAAAAGFDEWRKSVIGGKTYIVDALVRRRTAEKALFLRPPTGIVATPRHELPPVRVLDTQADDGAIEVFEKSDASGFVAQTPYGSSDSQARDSQARDSQDGILTLSETVTDDVTVTEDVKLENVYIHEETVAEEKVYETPLILDKPVSLTQDIVDENIVAETVGMGTDISETDTQNATPDEGLSPIAVAAAQVSERLDRLIDDEQGEDADQLKDEKYGSRTSAPPELEKVEQAQVGNEGVGHVFPTMTLVEMDIPGNLEYNLQAPIPEEVGNKEVKGVNISQVEPTLTLVEAGNDLLGGDLPDNDLLDDHPLDGIDNGDELERTSDFSHPAHNAHNGVPKALDQQAAPEADTQGTKNTIDEHGTTTPQERAPIAALSNASPNLVEDENSKGIGSYVVALVIGLVLLGTGLWKTKFAPSNTANDWIAFMAPITLLIGGLILLGGLYYMVKSHFNQHTVN